MVGLILGLTVLTGRAGAESPIVVGGELAVDGVFVAPERPEVSESQLVESVKQARALGLRLVVVVPNDPQPDPKAFARRILEASDADVALVFPPDGGLEANVVDEFASVGLRALTAARSKSNPVVATDTFTQELLAEPSRSIPPVVSRTVLGVVVLAVILAAVVMLEQGLRRGLHPGPLWSKPSWRSKAG